MRLEMAEFPVASIKLGDRFQYHSGELTIDRTAIEHTVLEEKRIEAAWLDVVAPGDKVRITGIRDVVEPRVKVDGNGQVFPGVLGPVEPVGEGRTHRLSGMAVFVTAEYEGTVRAGLGVQRSAILDMWGTGADASPFSALRGLVLNLRMAKGLSELTAHTIIQRAAFETAKRLAEATVALPPERLEVFELGNEAPELPKVILIQGCLTDSPNPHSGVGYFGMPIRDSLATMVHPNEFLDGAFSMYATRCIAYFPVTWDWQNHPLLLGLYREHRKRSIFWESSSSASLRYLSRQGSDRPQYRAARDHARRRCGFGLLARLGQRLRRCHADACAPASSAASRRIWSLTSTAAKTASIRRCCFTRRKRARWPAPAAEIVGSICRRRRKLSALTRRSRC